ncbi:hypothetical protein FOWG_16023 [Fusarium oxysporum f. sp. lycopersici MN25]|nr:hypothetical protein FOWG_16023 [Fusarium oxysporum f. sp. lycopersici MN25]
MTPSITDDDDEAHFSHSSDRTINPFRLRQKEPAYLGIPSDSSVSNSSPAGAGLDSRWSKTEMRMKYLLNIIKLMVPWKSSPPTEDPSHDQGSEPLFPVPPSDPPPYNIPSSQAMHYFPKLSGHISKFNHTTGRLLRHVSAPPSPRGYRASQGAEQTLSQQLVSKAMMLATVQLQHQLQAGIAGITGDVNERHRQECGLKHQHLTVGVGENKEDLKPRHFLAELKQARQGLIDQLNSTTEKLRRKVVKLEGRA